MATKTGGGLLGRADSTLVQGALKAELANIAPDMRGVYKMQAENVTNLQTAVQDFFYAFDKSNNDLENEVKELTPKLLADIETGTYIDDSYVDLVSQEINSLRQQMKSIPRGREGEAERAKIKARLANLKAESGSAEQTMTKIATLIDNDQIDFNSLQTGDMELWKSILNKTAKREFVDGKLVYTANINGEELKISHSDLEKRFIPKQYGVQTDALKLSGGYTKIGRSGVAFDFDEAVNSYEGLMKNKAGFLHLINNPFSTMKYSFKDALKGKDPKIVGELMGALNNVGGFDIDNDGIPDKITKSNLNTLVDTLTNPDNKNFNLATSKRVAAAFYAENDAKAQHKKGFDIFTAKQDELNNNNKPENDGFFGFQPSGMGYISAETQSQYRSSIDNRATYGDYEGLYGTYEYDSSKDIYTDIDTKTTYTPFELAKREHALRKGETANDFATLTTTTGFSNLGDLEKAGIDKETFKKPAKDILGVVKKVIDLDKFDVYLDQSFFGKKGDVLPFAREQDQFVIVDLENKQEYKFNTNYFKSPTKAQSEFERFFDILNNNNIFKYTTSNKSKRKKLDKDGS